MNKILLFIVLVASVSALQLNPIIIPTIIEQSNATLQVSLTTPSNNSFVGTNGMSVLGYHIVREPNMPLQCTVTVDASPVISNMNPDIVQNISFNVSEGSHIWGVSCTGSTQTAAAVPFEFVVDITPPQITLASTQVYSTTGNATIMFTATDVDELLDCSIDNTQLVVSSGQATTYLMENVSVGTHPFTLSCMDDANNTATEQGEVIVSTNSTPFLSVTSNKPEYNLGEQGYLIINAPQTGTVTLLISTPVGLITRQFQNRSWPGIELMDFLNVTGTYTADVVYFQGQFTAIESTTFTVANTLSVGVSVNDSVIGTNEGIVLVPSVSGATGTLSYLWDFGDGNNAGGSGIVPSQSHSYSTPGLYTVTLHVMDSTGNSAQAQQEIEVVTLHSLTVNVLDTVSGGAVSDAIVEFPGDSGRTNSNGQVTLSVYDGTYDIRVSKTNYITYTEEITVSEDRTTTIYITRQALNDTVLSVIPVNNTVSNPVIPDEVETPEESEIPELAEVEQVLDQVEKKIQEATTLSGDDATFAEAIRYEQSLSKTKQALQRIIRDATILKQSSSEDKEERIAELFDNFENIKKNSIIDFVISDYKQEIIIADAIKVESLIEELASLSKKEQKTAVDALVKLQGRLRTATEYWIAELSTIEESRTWGVVRRTFNPEEELPLPLEELVWYELVEDGEFHHFSGSPKEQDGKLQYGFNELAIVYGMKGVDEVATLESISGIAMPKGSTAEAFGLTSITGNSVFSNFNWEQVKIAVQIVIILVLVLVYIAYQFDLWEKFKRETPVVSSSFLARFGSGQVRQMHKQIAGAFDLLENKKNLEGSQEAYRVIMKSYNELPSKQKANIYLKTQELYYVIATHQARELGEQAKIYVKYGKRDAARKAYDQIRQIYPGLPPKFRVEVGNIAKEVTLCLERTTNGK